MNATEIKTMDGREIASRVRMHKVESPGEWTEMVVDAIDLCYSKDHIDTFALLSGDSDFSPLVNKLKENDKRVIGVGVKKSTSDLLIAGCDEFIYYDDLVRDSQSAQNREKKRAPKKPAKTAAKKTQPAKQEEKQEEKQDDDRSDAAIELGAEDIRKL